MYRIIRVPLTPGRSTAETLWTLRRQQAQAYNAGVELGLAAGSDERVPSAFDGFKELTRRRADGRLPRHTLLLQRGGLRLGLEAVRRHRDSRRRLERAVEYWAEQDGPEAPARLDRARRRLERHVARGTHRLFRSRKDAERQRGPALVYHEGARLDGHTIVLPGRVVLAATGPVEIPDGWRFTGAVQVVDVTRRVTRRTGPEHRRYVAMLSVAAPDPEPEPPTCRDDVLGVDMGVAVPVMTSEADEHHLPDESDLVAEQRGAQRARSRCRRGSRRWKRHARRRRAVSRRLRNRRRNASRQVAARVAATPHRMVAAEDLQVRNMVGSARGTAAHPGRGVRAKTRLNRSLHRVAIGRLLDDVERACLLRGTVFIQVPAAGTSRECHRCGAEGRRETQALFVCPRCGWSGNADLNAARNVQDRAWDTAAGVVVERRPAGGSPVTSRGRQE